MFKDGFDLPEKHADLRHGVFGIGGNGLAMPAQNHELAAGAGIRAVEAGRAKFADEVFCTVSGKLILALTFLALFLKLPGPFLLVFLPLNQPDAEGENQKRPEYANRYQNIDHLKSRRRPARGQASSGLKDGLQCLHHCPDTTRAGLVQKIVLLERSLSFGCVQVATLQQCATEARAVLGFKSGHQLPHFPVRCFRGRPILPVATSVLEPDGEYAPGDRSAYFLLPRHSRPKPAGESECRVLVETKIVTE